MRIVNLDDRAMPEQIPVHFFIACTGEIEQRMDIELSPLWDGDETSSRRSVWIGYERADGGLADAQFHAAVHLHRWIRQSICGEYGVWFPLNREHVIAAPWESLYAALDRIDDEHALADALLALETLKRKGLLEP